MTTGSVLKELATRAERLNKEKNQLNEDVKAFTDTQCSPDDFKGIGATAFQDLINVLNDALNFEDRCTKRDEWQTCYDEAQLHEPNQLPMLLDTKTLSQKHAALKKVPLLALLRENPKAEWCEVVSCLHDLSWTAAEIAQFPIALCRAYIKNTRPDNSRDDVRRIYRYDEYPSQPLWLSAPEKLLAHLLRSFYHVLSKEERIKAAKAIDTCSVQSCPLGAKVRLFNSSSKKSKGEEHMDLVRHILKEYHDDPLSLACENFRSLMFCGSRIVDTYGFVRVGDCRESSTLTYFFPELCYVFSTMVKVRYHRTRFPSTASKYEHKKTQVTVKINSEWCVPFISSYNMQKAKKDEPSKCGRKENVTLEETTFVFDGSVCKSIRIDVPSGCDIHDIKIYGDMLLLF